MKSFVPKFVPFKKNGVKILIPKKFIISDSFENGVINPKVENKKNLFLVFCIFDKVTAGCGRIDVPTG